jgi:hypothetical protein
VVPVIFAVAMTTMIGCVGPDPIFRFGGDQTDDAGSPTGAGGSSPTTGAGGSSPTTGAGGSPTTGAGGSPATGHGGSGGTSTTGAGGAGGSSTTGAGGTVGPGGAPGTVLLMDDFESGNKVGWISNVSGEWGIVMDGTTNVYKVTPAAGGSTSALHAVAAGDVGWTNIAVQAKVKVLSAGGSSSSYFAGPCVRFASPQNYYCAVIRSDGRFSIRARINDSGTSLVTSASSAGTLAMNTWYTVKIAVNGANLTASVNGTTFMIMATDASIATGGVALVSVNETAEFDDVVVTAN